MILAGDIGGTKSHLALFASEGDRLRPLSEETYQSADHTALETVIQKFLITRTAELRDKPIIGACFGVPCPVVDNRCKTPNLPWTVSAEQIKKTAGIGKVSLINDLESSAYGITLLDRSELVALQTGSPQAHGNAALISAGTGLGEALLYRKGDTFRPLASEGGHADFAPRNEIELELLRYLLTQFKHVSYERVVSGPGLFNIYRFLRDSGYGEEAPWLTERLKKQDPGVTVSSAALAGESDLCVKALDLFVSIYGAEAGNLALKVRTLGGLYVGGGIAPKIIRKLRDGTFVKAFNDKGRLSPIMKTIPVRVILNPHTALLGAAHFASLSLNHED